MNIKLVKDTIDSSDIDYLIDWLKKGEKLTKGNVTIEFEQKWSKFINKKFSVFVNSGSSANLAAIYSLILSNKLKNKKIVVPAVSWVTTVAPAIQLGLNPIMCDCDPNDLGLNIEHLKEIITNEKPSALILVHVLGLPNQMAEIVDLCCKNDVVLIEDTCEAIGSKYGDKYLGTFGDLSTFSFYFGHHMSTIEGGMVSTDDENLYHILLSIRSHGWDRDLPIEKQKELRSKYEISDFKSLYTFYYPGFNFRSTDLQAKIGVRQLDKIDNIINIRNKNFNYYKEKLSFLPWLPAEPNDSFVSNFAFPIIIDNAENLGEFLINSGVECRPLICGSINEHPFWYNLYGKQNLINAKRVHDCGIYIPNHQSMGEYEIDYIVEKIKAWIITKQS